MREPEAFYRWIMPSAPTCPGPTADVHIITAARAFCEATRCWREIDCIDVTGEEDEILCVPPYASLLEIENARLGGRRLDRVSFGEARLGDEGDPYQITQMQPQSVALAPRGGCGGKLHISMFLKPAQNAQVLPDFLFEQYGETIAQGALATLLTIPDQPFTNGPLAMLNDRKFQQAKDSGFNLNRRGQQRAPVRTRSRFL